jgi:hypothetical protein
MVRQRPEPAAVVDGFRRPGNAVHAHATILVGDPYYIAN